MPELRKQPVQPPVKLPELPFRSAARVFSPRTLFLHAQARFYFRKASHLNPEDSKLYFRIAGTYMNEQQWNQAVKHLETAMNIHPNQPEYNLAMGECRMRLDDFRQAIHYFSNVVRLRPKNVSSWEALIRCLFTATYYEEALEQVQAAILITDGKPVFSYYLSAIYFAMGKSKEGLLHLEKGLSKTPKLLKKFVDLNPSILQHQQVVDIIAKYKRNKSF